MEDWVQYISRYVQRSTYKKGNLFSNCSSMNGYIQLYKWFFSCNSRTCELTCNSLDIFQMRNFTLQWDSEIRMYYDSMNPKKKVTFSLPHFPMTWQWILYNFLKVHRGTLKQKLHKYTLGNKKGSGCYYPSTTKDSLPQSSSLEKYFLKRKAKTTLFCCL